MEFLEKLQKQKGEAKAAYIKARNECAVYVDSLKEMTNAEIEKQLL